MGTASFEDRELWQGVAEAAKHQRAILAAYRTGKGEWYAVVEAYRTDDPIVETTVTTEHEKCRTQKEAIAAGRRLMAEKVNLLSPETRIEMTICSELGGKAKWAEAMSAGVGGSSALGRDKRRRNIILRRARDQNAAATIPKAVCPAIFCSIHRRKRFNRRSQLKRRPARATAASGVTPATIERSPPVDRPEAARKRNTVRTPD